MRAGYRRGTSCVFAVLVFTLTLAVGPTLGARSSRAQEAGHSVRHSAGGSTLRLRWTAEVAADRTLVRSAAAVRYCHDARARRCQTLHRALQSAGRRLARTVRRLRQTVRSGESFAGAHAARRRARVRGSVRRALRAPVLTLHGGTLLWKRVGGANNYIVARQSSGSPTQYYVVSGTRFMPPPAPGQSVAYRVRAALAGSAWSTALDVRYGQPPTEAGDPRPSPISLDTPASQQPPLVAETKDTQASPILTANGEVLSWGAIADTQSYIVRARLAGGAESYTVVNRTTLTPPAVPGVVVIYSVRTAATGSAWSNEVGVSYPATPPVETTPPGEEGKTPPILGIVGGSGWGPQVAKKVIAVGFTSERLEADSGYTTDKESYENGFRNDQIIIGNTPDGDRLSTVNIPTWVAHTLAQVKEAVSFNYTLLEVGNEMYLKGGVHEPVKYAEMYVALAHAVTAAGIKGVTLMFNAFGDYETAGGELSLMSSGRGWLGDALKAEPELKQLISAFSNHPYGIPGVKYVHGDWGMEGLEAQHHDAVSLGFAHTGFYATEYGESNTRPSSMQIQAERIKWAYDKMLAMPYVRGVWYYQLHDDSTGGWGLVSGSWEPRPALAVLENYIREGR